MKKITATFAILTISLGVFSANAQDNAVSQHDDFHQEIIKDMPSLDFFGEHKFRLPQLESPIAMTTQGTAMLQTDDFRESLLKDMPSLDFFGEYKFIVQEDPKIKFSKKEQATKNDENKDYELLEDMPSLNF
ncbi:hypothetical protein [Seonamhaeicola sp. ML3]|uniref:hypothetical protein n=1 Tax=Seonamhaeicola sp. ML3 TaxID=2937786 RepID=UPI0020104B28|nr:hypothetical protein [Seonamhaeicola sp. ML3]